MHICMVLFGDLRFDYRVFREAAALCQAGHRVSVVAGVFSAEPPAGWDGVELHLVGVDRSRSLRWSYPAFWRRADALLRRVRADAYHAHDLDALWVAARAARRFSARLVYDSHELWVDQSSLVGRPVVRGFWSWMERRLIGRVDRTIAVGPGIAQILAERYGLADVCVIRNLPCYRPPETNGQHIRHRLGLGRERPVLLYQGGFLTGNGLSELIEVVSTLEDAVLVLIGSGPTESALRQRVTRSGLEGRVRFVPPVPFADLHAYTCSADLGLCLIKATGRSFYHSLPNKLFEYLMAGLPVVASDFPEMRAVIDETRTGLLVDPEDLTAVRSALSRLLSDPELRAAFRQAALQAARRYCWEEEAPRLLQLYAGL